MSPTRSPAVAGLFYPAEKGALERSVTSFLEPVTSEGPFPKALIVPHAGYAYSGPIAACGYKCLEPYRRQIERVVLIGPAHRVAFRGIAVSGAHDFVTPLGSMPVDRSAVAAVEDLPTVRRHDAAHAPEHSLEVQLPFLQVVLEDVSIVPLLAGDATAGEVAEVLDVLWGGEETVIVVSSDLSHYHDYATACTVDLETARAIEALDPAALHGRRACGYTAIRGLLETARRRTVEIQRLDLKNSGDTAGPRDHVVGYGAWAFYEPRTPA